MKLIRIFEDMISEQNFMFFVYRGISIKELSVNSIDIDNLGTSWSLSYEYALDRAEEMSKHHNGYECVIEAKVNLSQINWDFTLGQFKQGDDWHYEYEIVLENNLTIYSAKIKYSSDNKLDGIKLENCNTGTSFKYDETMIPWNDDMGDYTDVKNDLIGFIKEF